MLYCLASRSWGWKKHNLRRIYIAMHRSIMDYAAPAWQPWLSETAFNKLEVAQNNCLNIITGVYRNSNIECRRIEADIPFYRTHSNQLVATAHEKGLRLPSDHPRREAIENSKTLHRTKTRSSFREVGQRLSRSAMHRADQSTSISLSHGRNATETGPSTPTKTSNQTSQHSRTE
jgi:hypothetical protein